MRACQRYWRPCTKRKVLVDGGFVLKTQSSGGLAATGEEHVCGPQRQPTDTALSRRARILSKAVLLLAVYSRPLSLFDGFSRDKGQMCSSSFSWYTFPKVRHTTAHIACSPVPSRLSCVVLRWPQMALPPCGSCPVAPQARLETP